MAQLTIYLDEKTLKKIESAAKRAHESLSKWVKDHLLTVLEKNWPTDYFNLLGSLADEQLERPPQPKWTRDVPRKSL